MIIKFAGKVGSDTIFHIESNNNVKVTGLNSHHPVIYKEEILALTVIIKDREQTNLNHGKQKPQLQSNQRPPEHGA
ncbi:MAG: hypothetical protein COA79_25930 [Planctomycetota bacterium]|nr:MAG: hypothetical protein COA79_25930 [Planctomycetota bacterium]